MCAVSASGTTHPTMQGHIPEDLYSHSTESIMRHILLYLQNQVLWEAMFDTAHDIFGF